MGSKGEEEDAPKCRGFEDEVDLRLGAIEQTNAINREREGERETIIKAPTRQIYNQNIKNWKC